MDEGPAANGRVRRLRAEDGIHMTPAGYGLIAARLLPLLLLERVEAARAAPAADADAGAGRG